ncbi:MAG: hypothetical protein JW892_04010 [Anaerolineae bacterium]|nr:hypothetical protein [Anaerolineae bacterium]
MIGGESGIAGSPCPFIIFLATFDRQLWDAGHVQVLSIFPEPADVVQC